MDEEKKQTVSITLIFIAIVGLLESFFVYFGDYSMSCSSYSCTDKKLLVAVMDGSLPGSAGFAYVLNIMLLLVVAVTCIVISTSFKRNGYVPRGLYFLAIIPGAVACLVGIINLVTYVSLGASDVSSSYDSSSGTATSALGGLFAAIYMGNFVSGILLIVGGIMGFKTDVYASRRRARVRTTIETTPTFRPYDVIEVMNHVSAIGDNPLAEVPLGTYGITYSMSPLTGEFFIPSGTKAKYRTKSVQIIQRKNVRLVKTFTDYGRAKQYIREAIFGFRSEGGTTETAENKPSVIVVSEPEIETREIPESQKPTKKELVEEAPVEEDPKKEEKSESGSSLSEKEKIALLREYKSLLDEGIITKEEFDAKKAEILGKK